MKPRVGLYFGSFNPVHIGHMAIAGYMLEFEGLNEIWFVVSPQNPLKKKETLLDDYQRLYMVQLATGNSTRLKASDIEFRLPIPSYTIDTLAYLEEKFPDFTFCLVMGEDNLYTLHKWKNSGELVRKAPLYVYPRPDTPRPDSPALESLLKAADVHMTKAPLMEISGTFIRDSLSQGKEMSYFLPEKVWKYIEEMHFYRR
jgi:nicotinate-nucleotide adenylyltransferase